MSEPSPDFESAGLLLADLEHAVLDFIESLGTAKAEPVDVITLSRWWFDLTEELATVQRRATRLRNEAFQASVRAAAPAALAPHELQANDWHAGRYPA